MDDVFDQDFIVSSLLSELKSADFVTREQFDSLNNKLDLLLKELGGANNG